MKRIFGVYLILTDIKYFMYFHGYFNATNNSQHTFFNKSNARLLDTQMNMILSLSFHGFGGCKK